MRTKEFCLIVGPSGSGKTTVVEELKRLYGLKDIESYTTRPPRYEGEYGHVFVTLDAMPPEEELVGYTYYNGNHYWSTQEDVIHNDLYVIDKAGIEFFKEHYKGSRPYLIINIWAPEDIRKQRMLERGDTIEAAQERIEYDKIAFADLYADVRINNSGNVQECIEDFLKHVTLVDTL